MCPFGSETFLFTISFKFVWPRPECHRIFSLIRLISWPFWHFFLAKFSFIWPKNFARDEQDRRKSLNLLYQKWRRGIWSAVDMAPLCESYGLLHTHYNPHRGIRTMCAHISSKSPENSPVRIWAKGSLLSKKLEVDGDLCSWRKEDFFVVKSLKEEKRWQK